MIATVAPQIQALCATLNDETLISKLVDVFYAKMLDDYRINRFFFTRPARTGRGIKNLFKIFLNGRS